MQIDGTTQPGYSGTPLIQLNGTSAGAGVSGLTLDAGSDGSVVRGLVINRFGGDAVVITGGSGGNKITGNYLGTSSTGQGTRGTGAGGSTCSTPGPGTRSAA